MYGSEQTGGCFSCAILRKNLRTIWTMYVVFFLDTRSLDTLTLFQSFSYHLYQGESQASNE